jgi:tetratricopeptide (TPR) repeat protein
VSTKVAAIKYLTPSMHMLVWLNWIPTILPLRGDCDAIDAYAHVAELDPNNPAIAWQLRLLRSTLANGGQIPILPCAMRGALSVFYISKVDRYCDSLSAYSQAIHINPYIPDRWFDLVSVHESCRNQISDAIDAYACVAELDPNNPATAWRLRLLCNTLANQEQTQSPTASSGSCHIDPSLCPIHSH